jgi:16S rRNA (cytosine1402-N4)-methyltransferase
MSNQKKIPANQSTNQPVNPSAYHTPVLLKEAMDALNIKPGGTYVDCTFGGGGHSKAILEKLNTEGRLIAFDQDANAKKNLPDDSRTIFVPQNFRHIRRFLKLHSITEADGILADLGVSSHQFDEAERGFSIRFDAAMDMRMDQRQALTAADILKTYDELRLHKMFEQYGEVTNAKTLAKAIVQLRQTTSLGTIAGFKNAIRGVVKGNPNKYFAQVFQALRIEVNDEMGALKEMLQQIPQLLKPGGRVAIITFHSIEDRLVKNFFRRGTFTEPEENPYTNDITVSELKVITKKPIVAGEVELKENKRSRSAKMRVAEKLDSE